MPRTKVTPHGANGYAIVTARLLPRKHTANVNDIVTMYQELQWKKENRMTKANLSTETLDQWNDNNITQLLR